jgi:sigma-B regulation protein RsbU (phosphoserine phosphatase)
LSGDVEYMAVPRPLLKAGAAVLLLALAAYSAAFVYYTRNRFPTATAGLTGQIAGTSPAMRIDRVEPGGPANRAGLRAGDRILAVNGRTLTTIYELWDVAERGQPGDVLTLAVQGPGDSVVRDVALRLDPYRSAILERPPPTFTQLAALQILSFYPVPFLVVAGVVLVMRLNDPHAWLLTVLFGGFIVGVELPELLPVVHPALRKPLLAIWVSLATVPPGALYAFFTTFPEATPFDRRAPWLKVVLLGAPLGAGAILAIVTLLTHGQPFYLSLGLPRPRQAAFDYTMGIYSTLGYGLALASLVWNTFRGRPETRRRTRVMLWGTAGALVPILGLGIYTAIFGIEFIDLPFWVWVGAIMALFLLPFSFAYAVVKHRMMEIPLLLRRSARYVVVHHAIVTVGIVIGLTLTFVFAWAVSRVLPASPATALSAGPLSGVAGAIFGVVVALATRRGVRKATDRLDRAFFREAYDARRLLQDLAYRTRATTDRRQLATLLEGSLRAALHPATILVLLRTAGDRLEPVGDSPAVQVSGLEATTVDRDEDIRSGITLVKPGQLPASLAPLAAIEPELVAPMAGNDQRLEGLLLLGPRLSDEPYGREDRDLIELVASQAGSALQNLRLASAIAERMEAERLARRELEIAREVQAKLLPQQTPALPSLDYAGICIQARQVGGDYYDFLYLGPGRLGLVLADISGKGISAALLMASLQASLRSHYAQAPDDLPRVLHAVNQTFFDSTATSRYATLFFGTYDETTMRLRYANCGHPPPVLLATDGSIQRLRPTGPAVGLFEEWSCTTGEVGVGREDTLVVFTDGVVEAFNAAGEEFGEERLVQLVREQGELPAGSLVQVLAEAVQRHSGSSQWDDFTLVVARGRAHDS